MVNQVGQQAPATPNAGQASSSTAPAAEAASTATVRRIFQFGSPMSSPSPSSPTSPTSPVSYSSSHVRMVLFHDPEVEWTEVCNNDSDQEWVILDSGSGVSLLPAKCQADASSNDVQGTLQNCQGGALQTSGTKRAELIAVTTEGEEVLLQHEFIVGNVTFCLVSLGQLYQRGWCIQKNETDNSLLLQSPGSEIQIPVEFRNRSFAIRAYVRQVSDMTSSKKETTDGNDELAVRTIVYVEDEIENAGMDSWEMTADGTPFIKKLTTSFVDPRDVWPFLAISNDPHQEVPEGQDLEGDVVFGQADDEFGVSGLRDELPATAEQSSGSQVPAVLPPLDVDNMPEAIDVEPGEEIEAVPEVMEESAADSLTVHDDLVVTARSSVKLLRDACRWLGVSQAGLKGRMFERCKKAHELALRRSMVEAAQEQYRSLQLDAVAVPVPPQPRKEGAVVALLAVDVWSRYVMVAPLKQRNAQTVGQALMKFISHVREGTVEIAFDNEPVLVAGVAFCKAARAKNGFGTIVSPNKSYDKGRTGVAERFVQTIRGLQKTLLCHVEAEIKATIPSGHVVIQWAAIHAYGSTTDTMCMQR
eukprot:s1251_g7.t1